MRWREENRVEWLEAELPGAKAAFSCRTGGVSGGPFASLNLGHLTDDDPAAVGANRARLAAALGRRPGRVAIGHQIHGAELAIHTGPQPGEPFAHPPGDELPRVDGHVTASPDLSLLVLAADCLPVALAGPGGVAMLHCGWRGLAAGIIGRGAQAVAATAAAIGPGIGPCCYEVGAETLAAFDGLGAGRPGGRLDLRAAAEALLDRAGIDTVESATECTSCDPRFFSHRRDRGVTGRQAGLVWIEAGAGP